MKELFRPNLNLALVHYPVVNKNGHVIASAVTNLDLHDIARAAKTYGAESLYIVTPLKDQIEMSNRIISHWVDGVGGRYNPKRREALELIRIKESMEDVTNDILQKYGTDPITVVTTAQKRKGSITFAKLRNILQDGKPCLLIFGTAWGLSDAFLSKADYILEPVRGFSKYNHLSVRSAAAVILDRIAARRNQEPQKNNGSGELTVDV